MKRGRSSKSWIAIITESLQSALMASMYLICGLLIVSFLDAPYFRRVLETAAILGRLFLGLALMLFDFYQYLITDGLEDLKDFTTDLTLKAQQWLNWIDI